MNFGKFSDSSQDIQSYKCSNALQGRGMYKESYRRSSFHYRLISDLLTKYRPRNGRVERFNGNDGNDTIYDCSNLSGYSFKIKSEQLGNGEYGIDISAKEYLKETLDSIKLFNNAKEDPIEPLNVAGDGYCLLHAISRGLIGRELFWHPLLSNMNNNMRVNAESYQNLLDSFFSLEDINQYIRETCPDYQPEEGNNLGFTCFHIFVLSQVLCRPIILLDADMKANSEYTGLFLPVLHDPGTCCGSTGEKNPPLLIAWSSSARNHFVPLVGVEGAPCAIPYHILPRAWGLSAINKERDYIDFDESSSFLFGLGKQIKETYLEMVIERMEGKFKEINGLPAKLVTSYYYEIKVDKTCTYVKNKELIVEVQKIVNERCLLKCMDCGCLHSERVPDESAKTMLLPGGQLFQLYKGMEDLLSMFVKEEYTYDGVENRRFPDTKSYRCNCCGGNLRVVKRDGDVIHINGDRIKVPNVTDNIEMIYWNGQLYDNKPEMIDLKLSFGEEATIEQLEWFYKESDPGRNSNAYTKAQEIMQKNNWTSFGNKVMSWIVDEIIDQTSHLSDCDVIGMDEHIKPNMTFLPLSTEGNKLGNEWKVKPSTENEYLRPKKLQKDNGKLLKRRDGATQAVSQPTSVSGRGTTEREMATAQHDNPSENIFKILLKYSDKNVTINAKSSMTYEELQSEIERNLSIKADEQIIKVGFPRKTLEKPDKEGQPIGLAKGETVIIDRKNCTAVSEEIFTQHKVVEGKQRGEK